jgi:UDP-N-acetylmuramate--alanine ligase
MDINGITFDVLFGNNDEIKNIFMPVYGEHNASNALVAIAIAVFLNISDEKIKEALSKFNGVKRRFTKVGEFNGASIIDDYGHHPTEIATTLKAARNLVQDKKLICVFQPHKYSRVKDLFKEFCQAFFDADMVIVSDIYSASQVPIEGINQDSVINGIKSAGHKNVIKLNNENELSNLIRPLINQGDIVFFTGAGTITSWAHSLQEQLQKI